MTASAPLHRRLRQVSRRAARPVGVLAPALALGALSVAPAQAASGSWRDPSGDVAKRGIDLHRVTVRNHDDRLVVRLDTDDITKRDGGGTQVWIDTRPRRRGPEFVMSGGVGTATDFYIWRTRGWQPTGAMPLPCALRMKVDYRQDKVRWTTGEDCLGDYGKVRVSVAAGRGNVTDLSPARHRFHPWVARG